MFDHDKDEEDFRSSHERIRQMPVYIKAKEIMTTVDALYETLAEDVDEHVKELINQMGADAMTMTAKIAGAEGGDLYDIRMENAAIIRKAAREIYVTAGSIDMWGYPKENMDYMKALRRIIYDEFRPLFAEWVASFDEWDYIIDRWGLFNPPGVNWDDKDPDEDIPWTNPFWSEEE